MLRFEIKILTGKKPTVLEVEELDPWPDADGYVRYAVSGNGRNSVIGIDKSYWESPYIMTDEDAWNYLEQLLYPEFPRVYSEDSVFSPGELELIRQAIGKHIVKS